MSKDEINEKIYSILRKAEKDVEEFVKSQNVKIYEKEGDWFGIDEDDGGCGYELDGSGMFLAIYDNDTRERHFKFSIITEDDMKNFERYKLESKISSHKQEMNNFLKWYEKSKSLVEKYEKELSDFNDANAKKSV